MLDVKPTGERCCTATGGFKSSRQVAAPSICPYRIAIGVERIVSPRDNVVNVCHVCFNTEDVIIEC